MIIDSSCQDKNVATSPAGSNTQKTEPVDYSIEVSQLKSWDDKKDFPTGVNEDDQAVRSPERELELLKTYGYDSAEYKNRAMEMMRQDSINFLKVAAYLKRYGHPSKKQVGETAASTPWLVIHHSSDVNLRNFYFKTLYKAYRAGDLDPSAFSLYLDRTYRMTHGAEFTMTSPYTEEEEIQALIKVLGFD